LKTKKKSKNELEEGVKKEKKKLTNSLVARDGTKELNRVTSGKTPGQSGVI